MLSLLNQPIPVQLISSAQVQYPHSILSILHLIQVSIKVKCKVPRTPNFQIKPIHPTQSNFPNTKIQFQIINLIKYLNTLIHFMQCNAMVSFIIKGNKLTIRMLDLYLVITPVFGLLSLLTLINLKFTLAQPKVGDLMKYQKKRNQGQDMHLVKQQKNQQALRPGFRKTLCYFLINFTVAEFCLVRRSRNKIPLLLSLSIIAMLSITANISYVFCFVGIGVTLPFILGKVLTSQNQQPVMNMGEQVKKEERSEQKLQITLTALSLLTNIVFIWMIFKNYHNVLLASAAHNFLVTVGLDNFVLRPIVLLVLSFTVKNNSYVDAFIDKEIQISEVLQQLRVIKRITDAHISALSPKKLHNSPSKVPKAKNIQIQPRVNINNKQTYLSRIDLTKILGRPKLSPISLKRRHLSNQEGESSYNSILNSHQKKNNRSRQGINRSSSFNFDKQTFEQRVQEDTVKYQVKQQQVQRKNTQEQIQEYESKFNFQIRKKNKLYSSKLIISNQDQSIIHNIQNNDMENQEQQDFRNNRSNLINQKSLKDSDYKSRNCDKLKISLHKSIEDENQNRDDFGHFFDQDENQQNYQLRSHSNLQHDNSILSHGQGGIQTSRRNTLLKINEDRNEQDLEQIDLNSPQRRKQQLSKIVEDSEKLKRKKTGYKKYSLDPNRHVIKHSTGQPYLEFLPNLLNKQRQEKKRRTSHQASQQVFSRKIDIMNGFINDSRLIRSVKRSKNTKDPIVRQNDQNKDPEFIVQNFN